MEFNTKLSKLIARRKVKDLLVIIKDKHNNNIKGCYVIK